MNDDKRILVIEDNDEIGELVQMHLATLGCRVKRVADGVTGLHEAQHGGHDLVVLDLMLPGLDGLDICRRLRGAQCRVAILMLSAKSAELERVLGLELGADDYLGKPFSVLELLARAKALLRRVATPAAPAAAAAPAARAIEVGPLRIDVDRRDVRIDGQRIDLTAKEFDLLTCFARSPGRVMTRMQLLQQVWGYSHSGYEHTVNTHINRLRAKIERDPNRPEIIETVWGVGYRCHDPRELRAASPA